MGLVPPPYAYARGPFVCGDWRLGPVDLPHTGILDGILDGYRRLGGLTPVEFINRWWLPNKEQKLGDWDYPRDDGFAHDSQNRIIAAPFTLAKDQLVDRFGDEFGGFLSPAGAKFGERAIPPSNLNTLDPRWPFNYHLYRVKEPFVVCAGPAAPAFEQPGQGVQYVTSVKSPAAQEACPGIVGVNVKTLVDTDRLQRAN